MQRASVAKKQPALRQPSFSAEHLFDSHPETSLALEHVRGALRDGYAKPFLLVDTKIVRQKTRRLLAAMPRVRPHYAVKANSHRRILQVLIEEGVRFEIASPFELDLLTSLGVPGGHVLYSNPVRSRDQIAYAAANGVEWFVIDSVEELRKLHSIKPDAKSYLRIDTPNIGSDWPLGGKFGAHTAEIREIIGLAAALKADLAGVGFHVGSQCRNPDNWRVGSEKARVVFDQMAKAGLEPRMLNIGGGYPVRHVKPIPSIEVIADVVNRALEAFPAEVEVVAEPGRYLVSDAGYFVCRVMGTASRGGKRWLHLDAGLFGGIIETTEGLKYRIYTDRSGPDVKWNVAGPTCDSIDVVMRDESLPADLQEGDFIYICNAGAYTTAYASNFNGFPLPDERVI
ncbi:MAG: type III PLP-dependent enzyme [Betaproteobacteria bacterium]|nr:type III PLP-dependent enzyme [Betaproteobacteria bacterium]